MNYIAVDKTCTKATNGSEGMYCKTKTNDGSSDSETIEDECDTNWNDEYICPTEAYTKWDKYVEEFKKRYDDLSDDDKKDKYINRNTLNKNKVRDAYAEFEHYSEINFDDDCIKEYYQKLLVNEDSNTLSTAALETLAIIAYNEPITRVEIDEIRGVATAPIIRKLVAKGLIKEAGKSDLPGRPILYKTTNDFLDYFNIESLNELPNIDTLVSKDDEIDLYDSRYKEEVI